MSTNPNNAQTWIKWIYKKIENQNLVTCKNLCLMDKETPCNVLIFDSPFCYLGNLQNDTDKFADATLSTTAVYGSFGNF